ncbi:GerMN domain-containing protein [Agromyces sp. MMS24-JH15]|uniref:GerMN domain-containing protein n=1 Tax=Agromyces sp. MMS24-JH15 TaxID=3243765 RepID=UPI00374A004E
MRDRLARALVAMLALVALAGCATIPSSGSVHAFRPEAQSGPPDLDFLAAGPQPGAEQEEILRGFIDAASDPRNDFAVAREFLTPEFDDEWSATAGATIDEVGAREFEQAGADEWRVVATPAASLRADGQYELPDSDAAIPLDYAFAEVDGEWRIAGAPPGILIDSGTFARVFRAQTLYFFDPSFDFLVPDVRWFTGRDSLQTSIVRALLAGPAEWLAPGVVSAFPEGARLRTDSVPVVAGRAEVDVDAPVEDQRTVQLMQLQLEESLRSVRSIDVVDFALDGVEQDPAELANPPVANPPVDVRAVGFDGTTFGRLVSGSEGIVPIEGLSEQVAALAPIGAALGPDQDDAAVLTADGVWLVRVGEDAVQVDPRQGLVTPALDVRDVVWSVPAAEPDQLVAFGPGGAVVQLPVPWAGSRIAALEVSRDGSRIVALLVEGARTRFVAAAIERDAEGMPVALGSSVLLLAEGAGTPLDAAWLDDRTVASLTSSGEETRLVTQVIGGLDASTAGPTGAIQVDGANSANDVRILTATGDVTRRSGVGWQVQAGGIRFLSTQQPG